MEIFNATFTIGSGEFFKSLGQYVYAYYDDGVPIYIGKGNGNRGVQHIKTKGYDVDKLYIVARNLERFEDKNDWQSFLLESFLISKYEPSDNRVSGHYKECFVMAKLSDLFTEFKSNQFDNLASLPSWYVENYEDRLIGKVSSIELKRDICVIWSPTNYQIQMQFYVDNDGNPTLVKFHNRAPASAASAKDQQIVTFLKSEGFTDDEITKSGKDSFEIPNVDIERTIEILNNLMG